MTRMNGYDAFLKIADIREEFLDEAYLPALFPAVKPAKKKKILAPLAALFSNRAVAAVLCGVLGLGVLTAVIGLSPLNPFRDPPVTEPPVTDTSDPDETPPVSEEQTEPETPSASEEQTEPETDPPLWELEEPYELIYTSSGDGTCKIANIRINPLHREAFTLTIPAVSPDGERVVSVENPHGFGYANVPYILLPEDYEALHDRIQAHFGDSLWQFESFYSLMSVDNCSTEAAKNNLLNAYPWAAVTDFYILDQGIVEEEHVAQISGWIAEAAPDYVAYGAEKKISDLAAAHGMTLTWRGEPFDIRLGRDECRFVESVILEDGIEAIGNRAFRYVGASSLTLPQGLTHIGADAFADCRALTQIRWPAEGSLKSIGERAFLGCSSLTELHLTGDDLELGTYAFAYAQVQRVSLGAGVSSVGEMAFIGCHKLETLHIGQDVTYMGPDALREAGGGPYGTAVQITFDESCRLTALSAYVFCTALQDTTLPVCITRIERCAFYGGEISYAGTMAEWEAIEKHEEWCSESIIVHCTDGDVTFDPKKN